MKEPRVNTPALSAAESKLTTDVVHKIIASYRGPAGDLEAALGMYMLGRYLGWRALFVIHSKKTVSKYQKILGIPVQDLFDEYGPDSRKSAGLNAALARPVFWKVVSGEDPIDREVRKEII